MLNTGRFCIKKCVGVTLIELMLSLSIGLLLLSVSISIYLTAQHNCRMQIALSRIQNNACMALALLDADVRMAGYIGCPKLSENFPLTSFPPYELTNTNKISITPHGISVRHASIKHTHLTKKMNERSILYVTQEPHFSSGMILLISDCQSADIFQVKQVLAIDGMQKIIASRPLTKAYDTLAEVSQFEINTYFIDKTDRKTETGEWIYALYKMDLMQHKTELIEGVNAMNVNKAPKQHGVFVMLLMSSFITFNKMWFSYIALRE